MFALPYELEADAARKIVAAVPSVELVRFGNSGTEVVLHATRLARACTGRDVVVRFEGQYHGWADQLEWSHHPDLAAAGPRVRPIALPGSPGHPGGHRADARGAALERPGRRRAAGRASRATEIAAILTEPIMGNTGRHPAPARLPRSSCARSPRRTASCSSSTRSSPASASPSAAPRRYYGVTPGPDHDGQGARRRLPGRGRSAAGARSWTRSPMGTSCTPGTYNANTVAVAAGQRVAGRARAAGHPRAPVRPVRAPDRRAWPGSSSVPVCRSRSRASARCSSSGSARRRSCDYRDAARAPQLARRMLPWRSRSMSAA